MARTMTPSGTPRPMPILAEVLRPPGRGVGEVGCIVDKTDVEEAGRVEAGRLEACRDEEVDMGVEVDIREEVDTMKEVGVAEEVDVGEKVGMARELVCS